MQERSDLHTIILLVKLIVSGVTMLPTLTEAIATLRPDIPILLQLIAELKHSPRFAIRDIYNLVALYLEPRRTYTDLERINAEILATLGAVHREETTWRELFGAIIPASVQRFRFKHLGDKLLFSAAGEPIHMFTTAPPHQHLTTIPFDFADCDYIWCGRPVREKQNAYPGTHADTFHYQQLPCGLHLLMDWSESSYPYTWYLSDLTRSIAIEPLEYDDVYDDYGVAIPDGCNHPLSDGPYSWKLNLLIDSRYE